ncbi:hypothetical protein HK405_003079, partial [Cladochytrium tenue]
MDPSARLQAELEDFEDFVEQYRKQQQQQQQKLDHVVAASTPTVTDLSPGTGKATDRAEEAGGGGAVGTTVASPAVACADADVSPDVEDPKTGNAATAQTSTTSTVTEAASKRSGGRKSDAPAPRPGTIDYSRFERAAAAAEAEEAAAEQQPQQSVAGPSAKKAAGKDTGEAPWERRARTRLAGAATRLRVAANAEFAAGRWRQAEAGYTAAAALTEAPSWADVDAEARREASAAAAGRARVAAVSAAMDPGERRARMDGARPPAAPRDAAVYRNRAAARLRLGEFQAADEDAAAAAAMAGSDAPDLKACLWRAHAHFHLGDLDGAATFAQQVSDGARHAGAAAAAAGSGDRALGAEAARLLEMLEEARAVAAAGDNTGDGGVAEWVAAAEAVLADGDAEPEAVAAAVAVALESITSAVGRVGVIGRMAAWAAATRATRLARLVARVLGAGDGGTAKASAGAQAVAGGLVRVVAVVLRRGGGPAACTLDAAVGRGAGALFDDCTSGEGSTAAAAWRSAAGAGLCAVLAAVEKRGNGVAAASVDALVDALTVAAAVLAREPSGPRRLQEDWGVGAEQLLAAAVRGLSCSGHGGGAVESWGPVEAARRAVDAATRASKHHAGMAAGLQARLVPVFGALVAAAEMAATKAAQPPGAQDLIAVAYNVLGTCGGGGGGGGEGVELAGLDETASVLVRLAGAAAADDGTNGLAVGCLARVAAHCGSNSSVGGDKVASAGWVRAVDAGWNALGLVKRLERAANRIEAGDGNAAGGCGPADGWCEAVSAALQLLVSWLRAGGAAAAARFAAAGEAELTRLLRGLASVATADDVHAGDGGVWAARTAGNAALAVAELCVTTATPAEAAGRLHAAGATKALGQLLLAWRRRRGIAFAPDGAARNVAIASARLAGLH